MVDEKAIEKRGYSKGYAAGARRKKRDIEAQRRQEKRAAFMRQAFLTALPMALEQNNWTRQGKKIIQLNDRVRLAWEIAEAAVKDWRYPG